MAKHDNRSPAASPSAEGKAAAGSHKAESAAVDAALDELDAEDNLDLATDVLAIEKVEHENVKSLLVHVKEVSAEARKMHGEIEAAARHAAQTRDHAEHARLSKLAHAFADFSNALVNV